MADNTEIQRVNYESDFTLKLKPTDTEGNELDAFPSGDFEIVFTCGGRKYSCSRKGDRYTNCKPDDDGTLTVVFDSHNLLPGVLKMNMYSHTPNALYPDGEQTVAWGCTELNIKLVDCKGSVPGTEFSTELVMPFAVITAYQMAVRAGYTGTEAEWLDMMAAMPEKVGELEKQMSSRDCFSLSGAADGYSADLPKNVYGKPATGVWLVQHNADGTQEGAYIIEISGEKAVSETLAGEGKRWYAVGERLFMTVKDGRWERDGVFYGGLHELSHTIERGDEEKWLLFLLHKGESGFNYIALTKDNAHPVRIMPGDLVKLTVSYTYDTAQPPYETVSWGVADADGTILFPEAFDTTAFRKNTALSFGCPLLIASYGETIDIRVRRNYDDGMIIPCSDRAAQTIEFSKVGSSLGKRSFNVIGAKPLFAAVGDTVVAKSDMYIHNFFKGVITEAEIRYGGNSPFTQVEEGSHFIAEGYPTPNSLMYNYSSPVSVVSKPVRVKYTFQQYDAAKNTQEIKEEALADDGASSAVASVLISGDGGARLWNAIQNLNTIPYRCFNKNEELHTLVTGTLIPRAEAQGQKMTVSSWIGSHELEVLAAYPEICVFLSRMSNFMIVYCTDIDTVMWLSAPYNLLMGVAGGGVTVDGNAGTAFQKGGTKPSMPESGRMCFCLENTSGSAKNLITPVWQYTCDDSGKEHWVVETADGILEADDDKANTVFANDFTPVSVGHLGNRVIDEGGIGSLGSEAQVTCGGILCRLAYAAMTDVAPTGTDSFPCPVLMMRDRVSLDDDGALWVKFPLDALLADGGGQIAGRVAGGAHSPVEYRLAISPASMTVTTMPAVTADDTLSETSENPVQNKVIASAIGSISAILDNINGETV